MIVIIHDEKGNFEEIIISKSYNGIHIEYINERGNWCTKKIALKYEVFNS